MPGGFDIGLYTDDNGNFYTIKYQTGTEIDGFNPQPTGSPPAGEGPNPIPATLRGRKNRYGLRARNVAFRYTGDAPTGYKSGQLYYLPIFTKTAYNAITRFDTFTYNGVTAEVVGFNNEHFGSG
jgi:hypothetical protein